MADNTPIFAGAWSIFVQPDGPNTTPIYLGCHDFGDMEKADGDITLTFCPDPDKANSWVTTGSFQAEPSPATFDITTTIRKVQDTMQKINCAVPFYVLHVGCGKKNVFNNWDDLAIIPSLSTRTARSWQNLAKRVPGDQNESMRVFSWSAEEVYEPFEVIVERQSIAETAAANDIAFCNDEQCASDCGAAADICETGYIVTDAPAGSPSADADVWETTTGGASWAETALDPFGPGEDIASIVCFPVDADTTRILVARGTTDAANPAEIAYSDDGGVTWTLVNVGSTNGQYAVDSGALFATDFNNIWLVTSGGYIYFSDDGAATWTAQEEGVITAGDYHYIHGSSDNVLFAGAAADIIVRTTDGGVSWSQVTATGDGGDILTVHTLSQLDAWVGTDDGQIYFTVDGGTTWTERTGWTGAGTGEVVDLAFAPDGGGLVGFMLHNDASPSGTVLQTINGGNDWRAITTPTNAGLNALHVCNLNLAFAVGEPQGGTAVVFKISNV